MKNILLIKLGGSVITDKSTPGAFRLSNVEKIGSILKEYRVENPDAGIVIVHGAGSFGHPFAKEYQLDGSWNEHTAWGISRTEQGVRKLNVIMTEVLQESDLPIFSFAQSSLGLNLDDMQRSMKVLVESGIEKGMIPMLYGDVCLGDQEEYQIVSGDVTMQILGEIFGKESEIVMVGDTKGVYDSEGKTILHITDENLSEVLEHVVGSDKTDVTGGMRQKIVELSQVASLVENTVITDLSHLEDVLRGDRSAVTSIQTSREE